MSDRLDEIKERLKIKSGYPAYVRDDMEWFVTEIEKAREIAQAAAKQLELIVSYNDSHPHMGDDDELLSLAKQLKGVDND